MIINSVSPAGVASNVWSAAVRQLTSLASCTHQAVSVGQSLAAGASVDLISPYASQINMCTLTVTAGAAGGISVGIFQGGTYFQTLAFSGAVSSLKTVAIPPQSNSLRLTNNDVINAASYCLMSSYLV